MAIIILNSAWIQYVGVKNNTMKITEEITDLYLWKNLITSYQNLVTLTVWSIRTSLWENNRTKY